MVIVQVSAAILAELLREGTTWLQRDPPRLCRIIKGAPALPVQKIGVNHTGDTFIIGLSKDHAHLVPPEPVTYCTPVVQTLDLSASFASMLWTDDQLDTLLSLIQGHAIPLLGPGLTTYAEDTRDGGWKHAACLELARRGQLRRQAAAQPGDAVQWVLWMPVARDEARGGDAPLTSGTVQQKIRM